MNDTHENNQELRSIVSTYNLTRPQVATITGVSKKLVDCWMLAPPSRSYRKMNDNSLRLLKLELGLARPNYLGVKREAERVKKQIRGEQ